MNYKKISVTELLAIIESERTSPKAKEDARELLYSILQLELKLFGQYIKPKELVINPPTRRITEPTNITGF